MPVYPTPENDILAKMREPHPHPVVEISSDFPSIATTSSYRSILIPTLQASHPYHFHHINLTAVAERREEAWAAKESKRKREWEAKNSTKGKKVDQFKPHDIPAGWVPADELQVTYGKARRDVDSEGEIEEYLKLYEEKMPSSEKEVTRKIQGIKNSKPVGLFFESQIASVGENDGDLGLDDYEGWIKDYITSLPLNEQDLLARRAARTTGTSKHERHGVCRYLSLLYPLLTISLQPKTSEHTALELLISTSISTNGSRGRKQETQVSWTK
jgi:hypothetical protein